MRGLLLILLACIHMPLSAQDERRAPITMVTLEIPWLLDTQNPGPYNDMMDELFPGFEQPLEVSILPIRRALRQFFNGPAQCFFSGNYDDAFYESSGIRREDLLISRPFNTSYIRGFSATNTPAISNMAELHGRTVAIDISIGVVQRVKDQLPKSAEPIDSVGVEQGLMLATQGRVAASIMVDYDYRLFAARNPAGNALHFDKALNFGMIQDTVMCKISAETRALIDHVNSRIEALNEVGKLAEILAPNYERSRRQFAERPHPYLLRYVPENP